MTISFLAEIKRIDNASKQHQFKIPIPRFIRRLMKFKNDRQVPNNQIKRRLARAIRCKLERN